MEQCLVVPGAHRGQSRLSPHRNAQAPKILPHAPTIVANIAEDLDLPAAQVNLKGKTTEKLGFTGRGEGIAAQAVALMMRVDG